MNYQPVKGRLNDQSKQPRCYQLAKIITEYIHSNGFKPGQKLPTQQDMMVQLNVSNSTMGRAIRELVNRGVLYSRRGQGTFVAEPEEDQKTNTIATLVPVHPNSLRINEILLWSIEDAAHQAGYNVVFCNTEDNLTKIDSYLEKFLKIKINGVIYVPAAISRGYYEENITRIRRLQNAGIEVVLCDRNFLNIHDAVASFDLDCVYSDDTNASSGIIDHLFAIGQKTIALVNSPMDSNVENRLIGYRKAMANHDQPYRSDLVKFVESYDTKEDVAGVLDELLGLSDPPDTIFAINDRMAEVVMACLKDKGVSIPQEIVVAGFNNANPSRYFDVPLTTAYRDNAGMGRVAVELLLDRISGKRTVPRHVALPTKLIIHDSCGSPQKNKNRQKKAMQTI